MQKTKRHGWESHQRTRSSKNEPKWKFNNWKITENKSIMNGLNNMLSISKERTGGLKHRSD